MHSKMNNRGQVEEICTSKNGTLREHQNTKINKNHIKIINVQKTCWDILEMAGQKTHERCGNLMKEKLEKPHVSYTGMKKRK